MLLLEATLPIAQTALTAFLVICRLVLVIFVEPPTTLRRLGLHPCVQPETKKYTR